MIDWLPSVDTRTGRCVMQGVESKELTCPICGWISKHDNTTVAVGKLHIHISYGHTRDQINAAVDDGRLWEINGKFGISNQQGRGN